MIMTKENHESMKKIKELRIKNANKMIKCYCVKKYGNGIKIYEVLKISHKKIYYDLDSDLVTIGTIRVGLNIHSIDFVSESKEEALNYVSEYMKKIS